MMRTESLVELPVIDKQNLLNHVPLCDPTMLDSARLHKLRIAVLAGGWSQEADVSLESGFACAKALQSLNAEVILIDPDPFDLASQLVSFRPDLVFNALHGTGGEDGTITRQLDSMGLLSTHASAEAANACYDKLKTRQVLPDFLFPKLIQPAQDWWEDFYRTRVPKTLAHPCDVPYVIKPVSEGSSIGVLIVDDLSRPISHALNTRAMTALRADPHRKWMVEKFVVGQEMTVSVLSHHDTIIPTCVTMLIPRSGFYDYKAKYTQGVTRHICPAPIEPELAQMMLDLSVSAHMRTGCRGISRSDFRLNLENGVITFLEINTHPGMTSLSLSPEHAAAVGLSFTDLVCFLCNEALTRTDVFQRSYQKM